MTSIRDRSACRDIPRKKRDELICVASCTTMSCNEDCLPAYSGFFDPLTKGLVKEEFLMIILE